MNKLLALAASAACLAMPFASASAATVQLDGITFNGADYTFSYGGTLAPTEGITAGSKLVILDFAGYVDGSIFSPSSLIAASTEMTTSGVLLDPSITDDPTLTNLVFTYTGPDFQVMPAPPGSPYAPIDFAGLTARSIFGSSVIDGFATLSIKNEGTAEGSIVYSAGLVGVPTPAVPEPATWGMMIMGLGTIGFAMRRRPNQAVSFG